MIGLLLLACMAAGAGWFAWLFFVTPKRDRERIEADHRGTGVRVLEVERIGTEKTRPGVTWVSGNAAPLSGGGWYRIYQVTIARPDGFSETYSVGVEARLFGLQSLRRIG